MHMSSDWIFKAVNVNDKQLSCVTFFDQIFFMEMVYHPQIYPLTPKMPLDYEKSNQKKFAI